MCITLLKWLDAQSTESEIFGTISHNDPMGLWKQVADSLDSMKWVENRLELFYPSYTTATRIILEGYDFKGSMSNEIAWGISRQLNTDIENSKLKKQEIPAPVLKEVFWALATIRWVVWDLLKNADKRVLHLFEWDNIHKSKPITEAVIHYAYAGEISNRQIENNLDKNNTFRVVRDTTPILTKRVLEISTVIDGVPFIKKSRSVTQQNMKSKSS